MEKYGTARQARDDNIMWCKHFTCSITKARDIHSEYVICIAFPLQKWFRECTSILRYMYIACPVVSFVAVNFRFLSSHINTMLEVFPFSSQTHITCNKHFSY